MTGPSPSQRQAARAVVWTVNVGLPREVVWRGRTIRSGIWKSPVVGVVAVSGVNLEGDGQADRRAHGGPDKAVYAYAAEDERWWSEELGVEVGPASFGENLTTAGLDLNDAVVGERWQVSGVLLQVTQPRIPCYKLGIRMGDDEFPVRFAAARRPGVYLRILQEGTLQAGDEIDVVERPAHGFRAVDVANIYYGDHRRAAALLDVAELAPSWHTWASGVLGRPDHGRSAICAPRGGTGA